VSVASRRSSTTPFAASSKAVTSKPTCGRSFAKNSRGAEETGRPEEMCPLSTAKQSRGQARAAPAPAPKGRPVSSIGSQQAEGLGLDTSVRRRDRRLPPPQAASARPALGVAQAGFPAPRDLLDPWSCDGENTPADGAKVSENFTLAALPCLALPVMGLHCVACSLRLPCRNKLFMSIQGESFWE
jgi:hypothetical protein